MKVDPAELIIINEDVEPHYHGWVCEVPAHYLDEAKKMIGDLLDAGIISEVIKPVFVPQPGTGRLRLLTSYRQLNKSLARTEWPFMPSRQ